MHLLAFPGHRSGGIGADGNKVRSGDRVRYVIDGRTGTLDECLSDGDAFVTWGDGTFSGVCEVKWNHLIKIEAKDR